MANAYAFNPDRSKAPVYTKEEIDAANETPVDFIRIKSSESDKIFHIEVDDEGVITASEQ